MCGPSRDAKGSSIHNDLEPGSGRRFVLNPDGSDIGVLAEDENVIGVDWSPDGSRIAFTEDHGPELSIFGAPADGSTGSLVASLPNGAGSPVCPPTGQQITLGSRIPLLNEDDHDLVIDADGSGDAVPIDASRTRAGAAVRTTATSSAE